jgi:hypothetical protein
MMSNTSMQLAQTNADHVSRQSFSLKMNADDKEGSR